MSKRIPWVLAAAFVVIGFSLGWGILLGKDDKAVSAQVVVLAVTAAIAAWYAHETRRMSEATQKTAVQTTKLATETKVLAEETKNMAVQATFAYCHPECSPNSHNIIIASEGNGPALDVVLGTTETVVDESAVEQWSGVAGVLAPGQRVRSTRPHPGDQDHMVLHLKWTDSRDDRHYRRFLWQESQWVPLTDRPREPTTGKPRHS